MVAPVQRSGAAGPGRAQPPPLNGRPNTAGPGRAQPPPLKGGLSPQPGAVQAPLRGHLPIRRMGPVGYNGGPGPGWWWLGCHGGSGTSTLTAAVSGGADAGRYWPVPDAPGTARVVLVTRTHAHGLRAAQAAARQWASGALPGVRLLGLVAVADAPGRLPRPLRELLSLISGGVPHLWELPWVEPLRLGEPPQQVQLPSSFAALAASLNEIVTGGSRA